MPEERVLIESELPKYGFMIVDVSELKVRSLANASTMPDDETMDDLINDIMTA